MTRLDANGALSRPVGEFEDWECDCNHFTWAYAAFVVSLVACVVILFALLVGYGLIISMEGVSF